MPDFELEPATGGSGPGGRTMHTTTQTLDDGNTYDTGLGGGIDQVVVTGTTSAVVANVTSLDGAGTATLSIEDNSGAAQNGEDVHIVAFGERQG